MVNVHGQNAENKMNSSRLKLLVFFGLALLMAGCAETPSVFRLADAQGVDRVWPAPPERARYRYMGQLMGEDNFVPENAQARSAAGNFFDWLVGLVGNKPDPIVLKRPQSGMVDADGRIYVTDVGRASVFVFDRVTAKLEVWERAAPNVRFEMPIGIVSGAQGEVLVADAELHSVYRLDGQGNPLGKFGTDVLKRPTGLARDAQRGLLYVADTKAHDVKVFSDEGKLLEVIGRRGESDGEFNYPTHLTFANDKLYVADTLNSRIQIFDADHKWLSKFGQLGLYVGNLVRPKGVAVDGDSNIYVIESLYDNLLVFNGGGQTLLALGGGGKEIGQFYLPSGVWIDAHNQIYIADMFNGRVTVLQYLGGSQ